MKPGRAIPILTALLVFTTGVPASACTPVPRETAPEPQASVSPTQVTTAAAGPKNVIVMIGDGMGFNQLDAASLYRHGTSFAQVKVDASSGRVVRAKSTPIPELAAFDVSLAARTIQRGGTYNPKRAWTEFGYVRSKPTDSAAAATAMVTGVKTYNGAIGVGPDRKSRKNLAEIAISTGRKAGVVSSVAFSHATPAAFSAHDTDRDDYRDIARDQLKSKLSVIMGAGHPWYTDNRNKRSQAKYTYLYKSDYKKLTSGRSGFRYLASKAAFDKLTTGDAPDRVFGIARVASTLQQKRSGVTSRPKASKNPVPTLSTMTRGALNVLDADPDGLFLMVEGGAIDWANHSNQAGRLLEETSAFLDAISAVTKWVETNSSWEETLLIVTADHESGYLTGRGANPDWTMITGAAGSVPKLSWHSKAHTKQLVPLFARGAGAAEFTKAVIGTDPVRRGFVDNTSIFTIVKRLWQ